MSGNLAGQRVGSARSRCVAWGGLVAAALVLGACTEVDPRNPFDDDTPADVAAQGQVWVRLALTGEAEVPVAVRRAALCGVTLTLTGPDRGGQRLSVTGRLGPADCPDAPPPAAGCPPATFEGGFAVVPLCGLHPTSAAGGYTLSASAPGFLPVAPVAVPPVLSGRRVYLDLSLARCQAAVTGEVATRDTRPTWVQVWPALTGPEECAGEASTPVARVRGGTFQLDSVVQPPAGLLCLRAEADGHLPRSAAIPVDLCRGPANLGCRGLAESVPTVSVVPLPSAGGTDANPPYTNSRLVQVEVAFDAAFTAHLARPTCGGGAPHSAVTACAAAAPALPSDACGDNAAEEASCRDTEVWLRLEETRGTNLAAFTPWSRLGATEGGFDHLGSIPPEQCDPAVAAQLAASGALPVGPVCDDGQLKLRSFFCLTAPEQGVHGLRARLLTGRLPDRPQGQVNPGDERPDVASEEARVLLDEEAPPRSGLELGCAPGATDAEGQPCASASMRGVHYLSARDLSVALFAGEDAAPLAGLRWAVALHPEARDCADQVPATGGEWTVAQAAVGDLQAGENRLSVTLSDRASARQTLCIYGFDQARRPWVERRSVVWLPERPVLAVAPAGCEVRTSEVEGGPEQPVPVGCAAGDARWGVNNCQALPTTCQALLAAAPINPPPGATADRASWTARYVAMRVGVTPLGHPVAALRVENQPLVDEGFLPEDGLLVPWDLGPPRQWSRPLTVVLTDPLGREQRQTLDFTVSAPAPVVGGVRPLFCPPDCTLGILAERFGVPVEELASRPECRNLCTECVPPAFEIPGTGIPLLSRERALAVQLQPGQPPIGPVCTAWWPGELPDPNAPDAGEPVDAGAGDAGAGDAGAADAGVVDGAVDLDAAAADAGDAVVDAATDGAVDGTLDGAVDMAPPLVVGAGSGEGQVECPGYVVTLRDLADREAGAALGGTRGDPELRRLTIPFARYDLVCQSGDRLEGQQTVTVMVDLKAPTLSNADLRCAYTRTLPPVEDGGAPRCVPDDPPVKACDANGDRRFVRFITTALRDLGNDEIEKPIRSRVLAVPAGSEPPNAALVPLCGSLDAATPSSRRLPHCVDNFPGNTDCECLPFGTAADHTHRVDQICVWRPNRNLEPGEAPGPCAPARDPAAVPVSAYCGTNGTSMDLYLVVEDAAGNRALDPLGDGPLPLLE